MKDDDLAAMDAAIHDAADKCYSDWLTESRAIYRAGMIAGMREQVAALEHTVKQDTIDRNGLFDELEKAEADNAALRAAIAAKDDDAKMGAAVIVTGPTGCGKSYVMELIYRALINAKLHPYSTELSQEQRMIEDQPFPSEKVWLLIERNVPIDAALLAGKEC